MDRRLHSFTLTVSASDFVRRIKKGQKSGKVSQAIEWFFSSPLYGRERDDDYNWTGKLVRSSHGMPVPDDLFQRIQDLEQKLEELKASNGGVFVHLRQKLRLLLIKVKLIRPDSP